MRLAHKRSGMFALGALEAGPGSRSGFAATERAATPQPMGSTPGEAAGAAAVGKRILRAIRRPPSR